MGGARSYPRRRQFLCVFTKITAIHSLGTGCTLTAVPNSTQPSILRGIVNALWQSNNTHGDVWMFGL